MSACRRQQSQYKKVHRTGMEGSLLGTICSSSHTCCLTHNHCMRVTDMPTTPTSHGQRATANATDSATEAMQQQVPSRSTSARVELLPLPPPARGGVVHAGALYSYVFDPLCTDALYGVYLRRYSRIFPGQHDSLNVFPGQYQETHKAFKHDARASCFLSLQPEHVTPRLGLVHPQLPMS